MAGAGLSAYPGGSSGGEVKSASGGKLLPEGPGGGSLLGSALPVYKTDETHVGAQGILQTFSF